MLILFGALAFGGSDRVRAIEPGLYIIEEENAIKGFSCTNLNAYQDEVFEGITSNFGFKIGGVPISGRYELDAQDPGTELTGGAPSDSVNYIDITRINDYSFDWLATLGIDAVIVKASTDAMLYVYIPEAYQGDALNSVMKDDGSYYAISHIEFCYDYELIATKTANASFKRTYTWDITKDLDGEYWKFIGDPADTHGYKVSVDRTDVDSDWAVSGEIVVSNPTPFTVGFNIDDSVGGTTASVNCPSNSLAPGGSTTCTYSAPLAGPVDGTNTATITSTTTGVGGATATAPYTFGAPTTTVGYPTVNVTDTNGEAWAASGDDYWKYTKDFTCPTDLSMYEDGVYSFTHVNTAEITETGQSDDATVTVNCYAPVVSKTAAGTYDEVHYWEVTKTVDPLKQSGFIGDTVYFDWTIDVDEDVVDENHAIAGVISVFNPATMPMTVSISDVLDDGTPVTLGCGGTLTIPAGETGECSYSASPDDTDATLNTATATLNEIGFDAAATVGWKKTVVDGVAELFDDQKPYSEETVYDGWTGTYQGSYTCSTNLGDYIAGADLDNQVYNEARIYSDGVLLDDDVASTLIDCYIPSISKTAAGTYDERHEWDVEKTVDKSSQSAFIGDTVFFNWTITVDETVYEENFDVAGTITVVNPNPEDALVVPLVDNVNGTAATINGCTGGTYYMGTLTITAGATAVCNYTANDLPYTALTSAPDLNTAKITLNSIDFSATDPIEWAPNVIRGSATLDDDQFPYSGKAVSDGWTSTYEDSYTCSTDQNDYSEGMDLDNQVSNTAIVYSGGAEEDRSTATTEIDCYAPVVTKDASASYDETHTWDITKSVDPTSQSGYPGDLLDWTWTVTVTEDYVEENFVVSGSIYVANPAGSPGNMTVSLVDQLNDGTFATVDCGEGATSVTVAPGAIETCSYTAGPSGRTATLNTATGTFNTVNFVATAPVSFVKTVINGTAVVDDDMETAFPLTLTAGEGPWYWTEPGSHTCSSDAADYDANGQYDETLYNTATVTGSNGQYDEASASTTYLCEAGFVDLLKLTDGLVNPTKNWSFALFEGPDGFGGTQVGTTSSTLDDMDGVLEFGNPALSPDKTYTICELGIAAGWSSKWWLMPDTGLVPYNPDEDNVPPEDLGNRCVDFGAGTVIPITVGETVHFKVDNSYPGGDPRTPGYWKNWNRCTGGGQAATADANGGWEEGFWLLEDVLDPNIGGGISWADITIDNCNDAVMILDKRTLDGKKVASDPLHNLATHLLAAQLNFGAGACSTQAVLDAAVDAEELLDKYNFNGYGHDTIPKKSTDIALANSLATYLDNYNNGMYCGSLME
jgi:hypothetical protein